jgi:hypothetical protein
MPPVVDLGTLRPGESAEATITLRNATRNPVNIAAVATSCPCLVVEEYPAEILPNHTGEMRLHLDGASDLESDSRLAIPVSGMDADGSDLFDMVVRLRISGSTRDDRLSFDREVGGTP